jgi:hypothetical protein
MSDSEKENENENENETTDSSQDNDWFAFLKSIILSFITILIIGLLGANYVYLSRINLDMFFPTDVDERPYTNKNKNGNKLPEICLNKKIDESMKGGRKGRKNIMKGGSSGGCGNPINMCDSKIMDNAYFKGMFDYGFPYSSERHVKEEDETFGNIITNWFSNKVKYSNVWLRSVVKSVILFTSSFCEFTPEKAKDIIPFIIGPIVIGLLLSLSSIWYIPSLVSMFWNENQEWKGFAISIIGLFFGWSWFVPMGTAFVQMFGLMFKLILMPLMMNMNKLLEIMGSDFNSWYLKCLFFIMLITSAFKNLNIIIAIVMTIVFLPQMIPPRSKKE